MSDGRPKVKWDAVSIAAIAIAMILLGAIAIIVTISLRW